MSRLVFFPLLLAFGILGCGETAPAISEGSPQFGPHGGPAVELTGADGFAEVISEAAPGRKSGDGVVAVYFFAKDLKTPLEAAPTDVSVKIRTPDAPEPVDLKLVATPGKTPADKNRFASAPGPYMLDQHAGELTYTLGGQPATKPFNGGR